MKSRSLIWMVLTPVLALALAGSAVRAERATGQFERTLSVSGAVQLEVSTGSGHINVRRGESNRVHVKGFIEARTDGWRGGGGLSPEEKVRRIEANPPIEQNGNVIRIGRMDDKDLQRNVSIAYEIEVPAETELKADTGSGHQEIEGIRGPVESSSGSGHLKISDIGASVQAETGSGHIELGEIRGEVRARTGSGHISADGVGGSFSGHTGSGSVTAHLSTPASVDISTGSGSVEVSGVRGTARIRTGSGGIRVDGEPSDGWKLETGSGSIKARLPGNAAFELRAHSDSGSVSTAHPVTVVGTVKRNEVRGTVRGGGPMIVMETGSGNIVID